ncbi:hypothetical protein BC829DRAFT_439713 [Chytridium lagenaria]|nr:hypothetical protein BC829DRAFT_439713 [Chytridium lagenaria]
MSLAAGGIGIGAEDTEIPIVIWPEWNDAEIASEKWATKHAFEDPEGPILLPKSIRPCFEGFKRPVELALEGTVPVAVQPLSFLDEAFFSLAPTSASSSSGSNGLYGNSRNVTGIDRLTEDPLGLPSDPSDTNSRYCSDGSSGTSGDHFTFEGAPNSAPGGNSFTVSITSSHQALSGTLDDSSSNGAVGASGNGLNVAGLDDFASSPSTGLPNVPEDDQNSEQESLAGTSRFFQNNRHLLASDLMRTVLAQIHFLYEHSRMFRNAGLPDEFCPWENLYPKAKDGTPSYNPMGKYAVKLFWLGAWRRITIDDRIPVDEQGRPLVISSPAPHELWPMLITKALIKLAATSYKETDGSIEHGDFDPLYALKGWIPERLSIPASFAMPGLSAAGSHGKWGGTLGANLGVGLNNMGGVNSMMPPVGMGRSANGPGDQMEGSLCTVKLRGEVELIALRYTLRGEGEDGSEKLDLSSVSYAFRISDFRESTGIVNGSSKETDSHRLIRLKSYFTCGTYRNRRDKSGKPGEDSAFETVADGTEFWLTFNDFCKSYRGIVIYHSPLSFKTVRSTQCIIDPAKPSDVIKIPPVLYLPDGAKDTTIIAMVSTYGRCKSEGAATVTSVVLEPYEWKYGSTFSGFRKKPALRMNTNGVIGSCLKMSQSFYSREDFFLEDEGKYLQEKLGLFVRDVDETFPAQASASWFVIFKNFIRLSEPTFIAASLYVPDTLQNFTCLRIFDCDSNEEIPQLFYNLKPRMLNPNKNGYMVLADCRNPAARGPGKWKLRLVSQPTPIVSPERPLDLYTKLSTQDLEEVYAPNKHNILFRYVLKVKDGQESHISSQLSFSLTSIWIKLQVFDNDVEVVSTRGKGIVGLHAYLPPSSNDDPVPSAAATSGASNAANKKEDKAEKKEREREEREKAAKEISKEIAGLPALPVMKHRYILQGSIEASEFSKLLGVNGTIGTPDGQSNGNRPGTSRSGASTTPGGASGPKTTNSAKKKKQSVVPGFAGGNAAAAVAAAVAGGSAGASAATSAGAGTSLGANAGGSGLGAGSGDGPGNMPTGIGGNASIYVPPMEPHTWRLRLISPDSASLIVSRDTEKEDRYKAIKDSWEASHPGRAAKAREARDSYLKQVELGAIKPVVFMAAPPAAIPKAAPAALPVIGELDIPGTGFAGNTAINYVRNTDLVYKAWTIVKDGGGNGTRFGTFRDRGVSVLGMDGQRMSPEMVPAPVDPNAAIMATLRSLSNIRASVEGRPSVSTPPPLSSQQPEFFSGSGRTTAEIDRPNRPGSGLSGPTPILNVSDITSSRRFSSTIGVYESGNRPPIPSSNLGSEDRLVFESGMINPVTGMPNDAPSKAAPGSAKDAPTGPTAIPTIRPRVLSPQEKLERDQQREEAWQSFDQFFDQAKQQRQSDREWRQRARVIFAEKLEEMGKGVEKEREEDGHRRDGYRHRVIREIEEAARKALEALKAAEMAALEVSNLEEQAAAAASEKDKKKKAGKR